MSRAGATPHLLSRLRLRQVALLLAIEESGTLRAAATRLGMTQPAATKMVHELEAALGCRIFEREGRRLRLTAAGHTVLGHFHGMLGAIEALSRDLGSLREGGGGRVAVGSIMAPSPTLLARAVAALKLEQPRLSISVTVDTSDQLLDLLDQGALDLVVGRFVEGHSRNDYLWQALDKERLSVVVGPKHPLSVARRLNLNQLASEPWILQPRGSPMRETMELEFRTQGMNTPTGLVETTSILTATDLIEQAPMVTVMPTSVAAHYEKRGMLVVLPVRLTHVLGPYGSIVRRGRPLSSSARRFLELLKELRA